jgi:iron complex transport system substrate-binding protein
MRLLPRTGAALLPLLLLSLFCSPSREDAARPGAVSRVVSLSPSITRELLDLGSASLLVGVTSYDDYRAPGVAIVGTLVQPNLESIVALRPDAVLCSSEDGRVQSVDRLAGAGVPVRTLGRNRGFADICANFVAVGEFIGKGQLARRKAAEYGRALSRASAAVSPGRGRKPRVAFFLSHRPLIAASSGSFIGGIIADAGGACAYGKSARPYSMVSIESLADADPDVIILMEGDDPRAFFRELSSGFRDLKAVAGRRMYPIPADSIPYYTPADYVKSVELLSRMIGR